LSLALSFVNYQHWDAYRQFAAQILKEAGNRRVWVNSEWGFRHYLEAGGGLPLMASGVAPGDIVISSLLSQYPVAMQPWPEVTLATATVTATLPLRLITPHGRSSYSVDAWGFRPFDITTAPIDQITAVQIQDSHPTLTYLSMSAPEAAKQIISGIHDPEPGGWRWMSGKGIVALKLPEVPSRIEVEFTIPSMAPARTVRLTAAGVTLAEKTYDQPGAYTLISAKTVTATTVRIEVDKTFTAPPDQRELGIVLKGVGYR
jgi:hypothetical protein